MITENKLKVAVEKEYIRSRSALSELVQDDKFMNIIEKHGATLIGLCSAMINEIFAATDLELNNNDVFNMVDKLLSDVSNTLKIHPSDACILITKIFMDMMLQIKTVITLNEQNESEDK